jgi:proteasome component ECM29
VVLFAASLYLNFVSQVSHPLFQDDPVSRKDSAATLGSIAVRASDQMADGGPADVWRKRILPCAFIGLKDPDPKTASYWMEVWNEGGTACGAPITLSDETFGTRLEEKLLPLLVKEIVRALRDVSWARRISGASSLIDLCNIGVLSPLATSPSGSDMPLNEYNAQRAEYRAESSCLALQECIDLLTKPRLWTGKAVVLSAAVKLVSLYAAVETNNDDSLTQLQLVYACESPSLQKPVAVGRVDLDDLYAGDKWFQNRDEFDAPIENDNLQVTLHLDSGEKGKIDFSDCDESSPEDADEVVAATDIETQLKTVSFIGVCRLVFEQALHKSQSYSDYSLSHRTAAYRGLRDLLQSLPDNLSETRATIYKLISADLFAVIDGKDEKPVLVAGALECLAACITNFRVNDTEDGKTFLQLASLFNTAGLHAAWTVREASTHCMARLAASCPQTSLRSPSLVSAIITGSSQALKDRKFWRVR